MEASGTVTERAGSRQQMYATVEHDYLDDLRVLADADLLRRAKFGSDAALAVLLARHSDALLRFCRHLASSHEDAEDIFQETLARAIARVDSVQTGASFRSWLFRIAKNLSVDTFRSRKRTCPLPDEETVPLPVYEDGPHDTVETGEEHQTVAQALNRLAESHQRVLMLREVEGLSYAAIAEELNVSQSAVETLLFRARRRLREEYIKRVAAIPAVAALSTVQDLLARITAPLLGGPPLVKVAVTAALVGTVAVSTPQLLPRHPEPLIHIPAAQRHVGAVAHHAHSRVAVLTRLHPRKYHAVSRHRDVVARRHNAKRHAEMVRRARRHALHRARLRHTRLLARHGPRHVHAAHRARAGLSRHVHTRVRVARSRSRLLHRAPAPAHKSPHVSTGSPAPTTAQPPAPPPPPSAVALAPPPPASVGPGVESTGAGTSESSHTLKHPAVSPVGRPVGTYGSTAPPGSPGQPGRSSTGPAQPGLADQQPGTDATSQAPAGVEGETPKGPAQDASPQTSTGVADPSPAPPTTSPGTPAGSVSAEQP